VGSSGLGATPLATARGHPQDTDERGDPCRPRGAPRTMRHQRYPSLWIRAVTRGTCRTLRAVWPYPVRSSAIGTSSGPRPWIVPFPRPMAPSPDRVILYGRRGGGCLSRNAPGSVEQHAMPVAPWSAVNSGATPEGVLPGVPPIPAGVPMAHPLQDSPQAAVVRPRLAIASRRWRWCWGAVVPQSEVACHDPILETMSDARPLGPPLSLSQPSVALGVISKACSSARAAPSS
jgi:hypothetical protein